MRAPATVVLAMLLAGGPAHAQPEQHQEGVYGGVTPGAPPASKDKDSAAKSKRPRRPPPKDELTWIGFSAKEGGGGELFFQAPAGFTASQRVERGQVVIVLEGLRRQVRNTRRPMDTRYFDTPIARVTARAVGARRGAGAHKAGIEVRIAFKNPKDAHEGTVRTATEADGMFYTYVDFGSGGTTAKPADDDRARPTGGDSADGSGGDDEKPPSP